MSVGRRASARRRRTLTTTLLVSAIILAACGSTRRADPSVTIPPGLVAQARPIGRGIRFHPPVARRSPVVGRCLPTLGRRYGVHVELFAANRVVLMAAGIGTRAPRTISDGRVSHARCYGSLVTLDPTGVVLVRAGSHPRLANLFRAWGQALSLRALASFSAPKTGAVTVFVDGHPRPGPPGSVPLSAHAEVVVEVGPYVPPHSSYRFAPGT
jgi:hypothetical protein